MLAFTTTDKKSYAPFRLSDASGGQRRRQHAVIPDEVPIIHDGSTFRLSTPTASQFFLFRFPDLPSRFIVVRTRAVVCGIHVWM